MVANDVRTRLVEYAGTVRRSRGRTPCRPPGCSDGSMASLRRHVITGCEGKWAFWPLGRCDSGVEGRWE